MEPFFSALNVIVDFFIKAMPLSITIAVLLVLLAMLLLKNSDKKTSARSKESEIDFKIIAFYLDK